MGSGTDSEKMGLNATWCMAVGGMVGGGIFSVLGVVIRLAGEWAWASLTLAGLIALATGYSYVQLASQYGESGGAFMFLRKKDLDWSAGSLSWVLVIGYVLTLSVYAFTFSHYVRDVAGLPFWAARPIAGGIVAILLGVNLLGVGESAWLEIVTVWGKVAVLVGLAAFGLWLFHPENVRYEEASPGGWEGALVGAASIFMAYEGFQLLAYDYDSIRNPKRTLQIAVLTAIVSVIVIYAMVALGAASLAGAGVIVKNEEVSLAVAGQAAFGLAGKVVVSVAAAFSTASAINATLFATARLSRTVASDGELPKWFCHVNRFGAPDRAVIALGVAGAVLGMVGGLSDLVQAASLAFLVTFAAVNVLALVHGERRRWIGAAGAVGASAAAIGLCIRLALTQPVSLGVMVGLFVVTILLRPLVLRWANRKSDK